MSTKKQDAALIGAGAAACAVCCAGPILGVLAAIGLGTAVGIITFGAIALIGGALATIIVVRRRRNQRTPCGTGDVQPIEMIQRR